MGHKLRRSHKCCFETYKPDKKLNVSKEHVIPFLIGVGSFFSSLGGATSFFINCFFVAIKSCFGLKSHVRKLDPRPQRVVELRGRKTIMRNY